MDNFLEHIKNRSKYIAIIAIYFIFMLTPILSIPLRELMYIVLDVFNLEVEKEQFIAMFQLIFFATLTIIFIVMLLKELKDDAIKTKKTLTTNNEDSFETMNYFINVGMTYMLYILVAFIVSLIFMILPITQESSNNQDIIEGITTGGEVVPISMILAIVFFGPFVEEIVFRLALFKVVPHVVPAVLLSTFVFAGIHIDFGNEPFYLILSYIPAGVALSLSYYYSKNIFVTIGTHTIMNGLAVMFMLTQ